VTSPPQVKAIGVSRFTTILLALAVAAWIATVLQSRSMGTMPGRMGMPFMAFVMMWTSMMAAMMLPSVTPLATRYVRMIRSQRVFGLTAFASGYLAVWATSGILAFGLAWLAGSIANWNHEAALAGAIVTYTACGI